MFRAGDLRDDLSAEFAREFYRALSVVHDDLFFARYRKDSDVTNSLAKQQGLCDFLRIILLLCKCPRNSANVRLQSLAGVDVSSAASALLSSMFGSAYNEDEKAGVVEGLLDTRLLPATGVDGVIFDRARIEQRLDKYGKFMASNKLRAHLGDVEGKMAAAGASGVQKQAASELPRLLRQTTTGLLLSR